MAIAELTESDETTRLHRKHKGRVQGVFAPEVFWVDRSGRNLPSGITDIRKQRDLLAFFEDNVPTGAERKALKEWTSQRFEDLFRETPAGYPLSAGDIHHYAASKVIFIYNVAAEKPLAIWAIKQLLVALTYLDLEITYRQPHTDLWLRRNQALSIEDIYEEVGLAVWRGQNISIAANGMLVLK